MKRGDIVLINLPQTADGAGHEQVGTRPALIVHDNATSETLSVIMIVPFTSNLKAQRFSHTILVEPSKQNGLTVQSVLLVFQLRAIDKQRVTRAIGHLENDLIEKVNREMKGLLGLS
ncbi:MAG: type II toxin-antitoxin system PemK/MazF family toxin [Anaerolineales bacterium]|nr:type II toxin-antitoxin system PemK/MazF family toxin [Anaerolineales bacterium]